MQAGGECLSDTYAGHSAKYLFGCGLDHEFEAGASKISEGRWCMHCARLRRNQAVRDPSGLNRLQQLARQRGGECLSRAYTRLADK